MKNIVLLTLLIFCTSAYSSGIVQTLNKAKAGDANAQLILGYMFDHGEVVSENDHEAIKWYLKAAKQGNAQAQLVLAYKYDLGDGVTQSYKQAFKWYKLAAEQGDADAQDNLGGMYTFGEGIPIDYVQAYAWYNIAASSGLEMAKHDRDFISAKMTPSQIERGQALSKELYEKINENVRKKLFVNP